MYNPESGKWGQAHMQARYAILNVMIEAGVAELVGVSAVDAAAVAKAKELKAAGDTTGATEMGVEIKVHRDKIRTAGVAGVGEFLRKLQVYKVCMGPPPPFPRAPHTLRQKHRAHHVAV